MKIKTTKKAVKDNYNHIIGIGYCNAQNLLRFSDAFGYSSGQNGWVCDYFEVDNVCISTGYSYINNVNVKYDYTLLDSYESKARDIIGNYDINWEVKKEMVNQLLKDFVNECIK